MTNKFEEKIEIVSIKHKFKKITKYHEVEYNEDMSLNPLFVCRRWGTSRARASGTSVSSSPSQSRWRRSSSPNSLASCPTARGSRFGASTATRSKAFR